MSKEAKIDNVTKLKVVKNTRNSFKVLKWTMIIVITALILQSIPIIFVKNIGMESVIGEYVRVYYDKGDEKGGQEVLEFLESEIVSVRKKLDFDKDKKIDVFVYKNRNSFYIRKYGIISVFIIKAIDGYWYRGDNKGEKALMVSPKSINPLLGDNSDFQMDVAMHEVVHSINYSKNKKLSYFLDNGIAGFLAKQHYDIKNTLETANIVSYEFTKSENEIKFANGGYQYSYLYVKYINDFYGFDSVRKLIEGRSYEEIFNMSEKEFYDEWKKYLESFSG